MGAVTLVSWLAICYKVLCDPALFLEIFTKYFRNEKNMSRVLIYLAVLFIIASNW